MFDKILVIAAHSGDEIAGCGGALQALTKGSREHPSVAVIQCDDKERMFRSGKHILLEEDYYSVLNEISLTILWLISLSAK